MKKIGLLSVALFTMFLFGCVNNVSENKQDVSTGINLTTAERESIYDINLLSERTAEEQILLEDIIEKGKLDYEYSENEIKDIVAGATKYYLVYADNHFEYTMSYLKLKEKLKLEYPKYSSEIDDYFNLPWKNEYYSLPKQKDTFDCYGYKVTSLMGDTIDHYEGYTNPKGIVSGKIEDNDQNFTVKIKPDDTIEFYSNLTPGDPNVFKIIDDNLSFILGQIYDGGRGLSQSLIISKKTGLGIWTKINGYGMPAWGEVPYGLMTYIYCNNVL